jgi:bacterioferritin-associated ferredoxin
MYSPSHDYWPAVYTKTSNTFAACFCSLFGEDSDSDGNLPEGVPSKEFAEGATDADVRQFVEQLGTGAAALREISFTAITRANSVTDEGVRAVAAACTQLTSLSLFYCDKVTDEGVRAVAAACTQLTSLDLNGCGKVTDEMRGELRAKGVRI